MSTKYNLSNPSIKRIMQEVREMEKEKSSQFYAAPLEDDLFEWHFTIRGPRETPFEGGIYHGRIVLPSEYPFKPPNIILLTPNGRFEVGKKICLSISAHHPEYWQPSWSIRTVLVALIGFMPTKGGGAIAALDYSAEERKELAKKSISWACDRCGSTNLTVLPPEDPNECTSHSLPKELNGSNVEDLPPSSFSSSLPKPENPITPSTEIKNAYNEDRMEIKEPLQDQHLTQPQTEETQTNSPSSQASSTTNLQNNFTNPVITNQTIVVQPSEQDKLLNSLIFAVLAILIALLLRKLTL